MNEGAHKLRVVASNPPANDGQYSDSGYRCKLIDGMAIYFGGKQITPNNKKFVALIALFHLSETTALPRDRICALLWGDSPEDKAKASLRNLLYLQKDIQLPGGARLLASQRDQIVLEEEPGTSDVADILDAIDEANSAALKNLSFKKLENRLLDGLDGIDPAYDDWLMQTRLNLIAKITDRLEANLDETSPSEDRRILAAKLGELQPENEIACRYLMRLDAARGNMPGALKHYETLWKFLDEEFDIEPSEPTLDLVVALKTSGTPVTQSSPVLVEAPRATIFVRGFSNANIGDGDFFVRGIRAELMNALFSIDDWVVVEPDDGALPTSGPGFFELKGDAAPGLGQVRLILTLKDLSNGRIIWNHTIPIDTSGWQQQSAMAVMRLAGLLIDTVETNRFQQVEALGERDLSNYDRLMRARVLMYDWDMAKDKEAEALFRAVHDEGTLGTRAKVGLVELLNSRHLIFPGAPLEANIRTEAFEIASDCHSEAPMRPDVNLCLAWSALLLGRYDTAISAAQAAAEHSGSNPRRLASAAECMSLAGASEEGKKLAAVSVELDLGANRISHGYRVSIHLSSRDFDKCMASADQARGAIILGYGYAASAAFALNNTERAHHSWCGGGTPTDDALTDWLISASPLAPSEIRDEFEDAIRTLSDQRQDAVT